MSKPDMTQSTKAREWPTELLGRMTVAMRSAHSAGLPFVTSALEDAATEIILLQKGMPKVAAPKWAWLETLVSVRSWWRK